MKITEKNEKKQMGSKNVCQNQNNKKSGQFVNTITASFVIYVRQVKLVKTGQGEILLY